MITRVKDVIVGNGFAVTDVKFKGAVLLLDQDSKQIKTEKEAADASSMYVSVITDIKDVADTTGALKKVPVLKTATEIKKSGCPKAVVGNYEAPVQEKIEFDFNDVDVIAGHRYVLRIVYKDINEAPGQFTHTYEVVSVKGEDEELRDALIAAVNKHKNRRVIASNDSSSKLTLTALEKDDNDGIDSINEYSVVTMDATIYETIPGALLSNQPKPVEGLKKTHTAAKPGKGYWKQVRDEERRNMGYTGHVFSGTYPAVEQNLLTTEGTEYNYVIIDSDNPYLSNDNQYIKTTPLTTEIYVDSKGPDANQIGKLVKAFVTGQVAPSDNQ